MTQLVVMLTPQGDKIVSSSSGGGVSTPKKSSSSGALDYGEEKDVEENGNRKKTVWNGKELGTTETKTVVKRPGWSDEILTADYEELLSEFVEQRQLIQCLRDEVQIRDRAIQRLEKQLGMLLRQTISLPSLSNYG